MPATEDPAKPRRTSEDVLDGPPPARPLEDLRALLAATWVRLLAGALVAATAVFLAAGALLAAGAGQTVGPWWYAVTLWVAALGVALLSSPLRRFRGPRDAPGDPRDDAPTEEPGGQDRGWNLPHGPALAALLAILGLALWLRLLDPMSTIVLGDEDPYFHMERTWTLLQHGTLPKRYPPLFFYLLLPLAELGPHAFYLAARFLPPLTGVVEVLGVFLLARRGLSEEASLSASLLVALMPENVRRTNLLFPTALDLALLPWLALLVLRAEGGSRWSAVGAVALGAFMFLYHPWVMGLMVPVFLAYLLASGRLDRRVVAGIVAGAAVLLAAGFAFYPTKYNPVFHLLKFGGATAQRLVAQPWTLQHLPRYVDFPDQLTSPILFLVTAGAVVAATRWRRLDRLSLAWTGLMLPLALVNWFHVWFIPHRIVGYLSIGAALLGGILVDAALPRLRRTARTRWPTFAAGACALVLVTAPVTADSAGGDAWYRPYHVADYQTWYHVEKMHPSLLVAASWKTRSGYRAITGLPATSSPQFFWNQTFRQQMVHDHPDLVVLVDRHVKGTGYPTKFLNNWTVVYRNQDNVVYAPPSQGG